MLFLFRLLKFRFIGAVLVILTIATGNGEALFDVARTGIDATGKAVQYAEGFYSAANKSQNSADGNKSTSKSAVSKSTASKPDAVKGSNAKPGSYKVTMTDGGEAVRWCARSIEVVINDTQAPAGARGDLEQALRKISSISGVNFTVVGTSSTIPDSRYHLSAGNPYPPVMIAWATADQTDLLNPNISAAATANPANVDGRMRYVTGSLAINVDHDVLYRPGFGEGMSRGNLYLHELGHVLGLAHVEEKGMLMNPVLGKSSPDGYAKGDLRGLTALGC